MRNAFLIRYNKKLITASATKGMFTHISLERVSTYKGQQGAWVQEATAARTAGDRNNEYQLPQLPGLLLGSSSTSTVLVLYSVLMMSDVQPVQVMYFFCEGHSAESALVCSPGSPTGSSTSTNSTG
jgi:hypothetical protein